jgi:hypothetical protein
MSLDDLSLPSASFSSEAGVVLTFFAYFFVSRQKSMWGMGQSPKFKKFITIELNIFCRILRKYLVIISIETKVPNL